MLPGAAAEPGYGRGTDPLSAPPTCCDSVLVINNDPANSACENELRRALDRAYLALSSAAKEASDLAKQLGGQRQEWAYSIKNRCLSELVRGQVGVVNGVRPDGFIGLDIPGRRLHTRPSELDFDVQATVRRQVQFVPTSAPLSERLPLDQVEALRNAASRRHAA